MKEKKRAYIKPQCKSFNCHTETLLTNASGNAGTIQPGSSAGDAKRWQGWEEEETSVPLWASSKED
nr:hypothetical protein [uncultured Prevotella sp.]